jgi:hypothetical protein
VIVRWIGEKLGILDPPDEETERARADAVKIAREAHGEVNRSRRIRGVPTVEYELITRSAVARHARDHR